MLPTADVDAPSTPRPRAAALGVAPVPADAPPIGRLERALWPLTDLAFALAAVVIWVTVPSGRPLDPARCALLLGGLLAAAKVRVPLARGFSSAVQVFVVPALFVLPLNTVPAAVAAVYALDGAPRAFGHGGKARSLLFFGDCWFIVAPVLILAHAPGAFDWSHWPLYTAAFAAQLLTDTAVASFRAGLAAGHLAPRNLVLAPGALDALLTPIGLLAAAQFDSAPGAVMVALGSLLALVVMLSRERQARLLERRDALHDPLTGLPNRRLFRAALAQAIAEARRGGQRRGALVIDLDGFKAVNDSLGHLAGDQALKLAAARLRGALRDADLLARLGGDEFAVLLAGEQDDAGCQTVAAKLRAQLARPLVVSDTIVPLGASVGHAAFGALQDTPDGVLGVADEAMYADKRARRRGPAGGASSGPSA